MTGVDTSSFIYGRNTTVRKGRELFIDLNRKINLLARTCLWYHAAFCICDNVCIDIKNCDDGMIPYLHQHLDSFHLNSPGQSMSWKEQVFYRPSTRMNQLDGHFISIGLPIFSQDLLCVHTLAHIYLMAVMIKTYCLVHSVFMSAQEFKKTVITYHQTS